MKRLTKVDESKFVIQMEQKCAMGVGISTSQINNNNNNNNLFTFVLHVSHLSNL